MRSTEMHHSGHVVQLELPGLGPLGSFQGPQGDLGEAARQPWLLSPGSVPHGLFSLG